jgi:hypothetical protein
MSDTPKRTIDFMSGYWNVDRPIEEFCAKMELELIKTEKEREEARELVKYYQEYSKLLVSEVSDTAALAHVCGWRSNLYEQCKVLREKIKQLDENE